MSGGYRTWATNDVVTNEDFMQYISSQCIPTFDLLSERTSALGTPDDGTMCYVGETGEMYKRENGVWKGVFPRIYKQENVESRSGTVKAISAELQCPVEANSTYVVDFDLAHDGPIAGGLRYNFTGPAGMDDYNNVANGYYLRPNFSAGGAIQYGQAGFSVGDSPAYTAGVGTWRNIKLGKLVVTTVGTAGTFGLFWAQQVNSGTSRIGEGSSMTIRKVL